MPLAGQPPRAFSRAALATWSRFEGPFGAQEPVADDLGDQSRCAVITRWGDLLQTDDPDRNRRQLRGDCHVLIPGKWDAAAEELPEISFGGKLGHGFGIARGEAGRQRLGDGRQLLGEELSRVGRWLDRCGYGGGDGGRRRWFGLTFDLDDRGVSGRRRSGGACRRWQAIV